MPFLSLNRKYSSSGPTLNVSKPIDSMRGQRAAQHVARVALVGLALGRQDVAEHPADALLLGPPGQHRERRRVRHGDHVGLLDRVEAGDRGAVEAHPALEGVVELGGVDRERLQLAQDVGEPEPDEADLALLDERLDVGRGLGLVGHRRQLASSRPGARWPRCAQPAPGSTPGQPARASPLRRRAACGTPRAEPSTGTSPATLTIAVKPSSATNAIASRTCSSVQPPRAPPRRGARAAGSARTATPAAAASSACSAGRGCSTRGPTGPRRGPRPSWRAVRLCRAIPGVEP